MSKQSQCAPEERSLPNSQDHELEPARGSNPSIWPITGGCARLVFGMLHLVQPRRTLAHAAEFTKKHRAGPIRRGKIGPRNLPVRCCRRFDVLPEAHRCGACPRSMRCRRVVRRHCRALVLERRRWPMAHADSNIVVCLSGSFQKGTTDNPLAPTTPGITQ